MSAHTPGPWKASPFSSVVGCAITAQPDPKQNSQLVASTYSEANAALIAAAPDLLEALKASLSHSHEVGMCFSCQRARVAIAKAEGMP